MIAPIINRMTAAREQKLQGPRSLSSKQRQQILSSFGDSPPFKVWVAHNRHEAEPSRFHKQIFDTLTEAGLETQWFGGMSNTTVGVEISGDPSPEKSLLMQAFAQAGIPFQEIHFTDPEGKFWGLAVWIGINPGVSQ